MIAVDTSAIMRADERAGRRGVFGRKDTLIISAETVAEALVVADRRGIGDAMASLIAGLGMEVVNVTAASARRVCAAYTVWGKGVHPVGLNFGDCFAYEVAREHDCPLLFVGDEFTRADIRPAL
ncbi:type II toxin-antitoxin system VapC family toxin [Acuticoccus sediminis]|uniref:type II toxin-antitoxin system VapC family toxin n=1 Tax=Acuticoccus sediminis TaxID=2184697 RepID=UPI001CFF113C|nr:type II toxin-antitoxin system VapC family toxin [Acuticoccus sediminis]